MIKTGDHAGSLALNNFITKNKPLISIHGHIHESVRMSKEFLVNNSEDDTQKQSISVSIGNDFKSSNFSIVIFDTKKILKAQRYNI